MAKIEFKVSFVKVTDEGIERYTDVLLDSISSDERKDIKSLVFLPINSNSTVDITEKLVGFPLLETIYLPHNLTTTMEKAKKLCTMLKALIVVTRETIKNSLDETVVSVNASNQDDEDNAKFRAFVETDKEGRQTFYVTAKQVSPHEIEIKDNKEEMFTYKNVAEYVDGEKGLAKVIEEINSTIEDERIKIEVGSDTLRALLSVFVEKGITKNEFTIDFSKLYDKIESYKAISKSVNQVSTKEEVETNIVEAYQNVLRVHYLNRLKKLSQNFLLLAKGADGKDEDILRQDFLQFLIPCIVDSPDFDESYKEGDQVVTILNDMPSTICSFIKKASDRALVGRHLRAVVDEMKEGKEDVKLLIENFIQNSASLDEGKNELCSLLEYDKFSEKTTDILDCYEDKILSKDIGRLTKTDITNINKAIESEVRNVENSDKDIKTIMTKCIDSYPTEHEIQNMLVETISKSGYVKFEDGE